MSILRPLVESDARDRGGVQGVCHAIRKNKRGGNTGTASKLSWGLTNNCILAIWASGLQFFLFYWYVSCDDWCKIFTILRRKLIVWHTIYGAQLLNIFLNSMPSGELLIASLAIWARELPFSPPVGMYPVVICTNFLHPQMKTFCLAHNISDAVFMVPVLFTCSMYCCFFCQSAMFGRGACDNKKRKKYTNASKNYN